MGPVYFFKCNASATSCQEEAPCEPVEIGLVEGLGGFRTIDAAHVSIFEIDEKQMVSQNVQRFFGGLAGQSGMSSIPDAADPARIIAI